MESRFSTKPDNSNYGLYLSKRLSKNTGAELHVIRVIQPDIDNEMHELIEDDLEKVSEDKSIYGISTHLIENISVENAIQDFLEKDDILVIGDSGRRFSFSLIGDLPCVLAKSHKGPVLIIKKHRPISSGGLMYVVMKKVRRIMSYVMHVFKK
ncbi:universal stress protein [Methanolobus bombayensis]|uniref:universal stress protein n=1 Tax=Methanolobus bombayensis TaxID=38023 RepID=UPI001AE5A249|nr:universal stress protein [Methanolobus bombayensis]MBP1909245.1 hypothetical protein [Methanolobus bombayensis]